MDLQNKIIVDPHYLSGIKEKWNLEFRHTSFRDNVVDYNLPPEKRNPMLVSISLVAIKEHESPTLRQTVDIGRMVFLAGSQPESIKLTANMDDSIVESIVESLVGLGYAKQVGTRTERHQDYPGSEIESFHYTKLDVTDYYNSYISYMTNKMDNSPISDIRLVEKYDDPYCLTKKPLDYMTCRIGGIEQERRWVGMDGVNDTRTAELYPHSRHQLYALAAKAHSKQLQLYEDACKRMTDYTAYEAKGQFRIRCKIDGVQQMSKEVSRDDIQTYLAYKDAPALVAKYYKDELTEGIKNSISRSR